MSVCASLVSCVHSCDRTRAARKSACKYNVRKRRDSVSYRRDPAYNTNQQQHHPSATRDGASPHSQKLPIQRRTVLRLEVLLPATGKFDAVALLQAGSPEEIKKGAFKKAFVPWSVRPFLPCTPCSLRIVDEKTSFQIVLRTSVPEETARGLLPSLDLTVSAHATNAVPEGPGNSAAASGKHDIASTKAPATDNVVLVTVKNHTYVIWKPTLHLVRPRVRLQRPAVYFTANLGMRSSNSTTAPASEKQYLPSFEPLPANVLESLHHDPSLGSSAREIHVSETRVTKVSPSASQLEDNPRPLRGATKRAFPAVPAFFMRIGYSPLPDATIASLHVEISPLITGDVLLDDVRLELPGTVVQGLNEAIWPQRSKAGDEVVLLYRIERSSPEAASTANGMDLAAVSIGATAYMDPDSSVQIETQWQAQVDMSHSQKAAPYKWSRPLSTSNVTHRRMLSQTSSRPSIHEVTHNPAKEGEIIFTFTAPPTTKQGSIVEVQVQCLNKSNRSRKFALVTAQRRGSTASAKPRFEKRAASNDTTIAVEAHETSEQHKVLTLTPDIRIGPLTAGACFETNLKYQTTSAGVVVTKMRGWWQR